MRRHKEPKDLTNPHIKKHIPEAIPTFTKSIGNLRKIRIVDRSNSHIKPFTPVVEEKKVEVKVEEVKEVIKTNTV